MSISIGPSVPRRGNGFSRLLGRLILRLLGWRLRGSIPDIPKMLVIGAPHTSNMDGVISIATLFAVGMQASTLIKSSAFAGLGGVALRWFGAIPVDRANASEVVAQSVAEFQAREQFILLMSPEGTRRGAVTWKSGFQRVCVQAGVPLLPAACDYRRKVITFGPPFEFSGDYAEDMARLMAFYSECAYPKHPDRMSEPMREALKHRL